MSARRRAGRVNVAVLVMGLVLVVPLVALLASGFGTNPREVPSVLVDQPAPGFTLVDLEGTTWSLDELEGKPVVLNFWSTWCLPCKQEHDLLQQAARMYPEIQFLGVIYNDEPAKCRRYLQQKGTAYHHLIDPDGQVALDYGVAGVPETFVIDREGRIVHKQAGVFTARLVTDLLGPLARGS